MGFVGAKDEIPTDWMGAKHGCRDILNAELASIHNSREAAKVTTMLLDIPFVDFDDPIIHLILLVQRCSLVVRSEHTYL